ncbi:MAG: hypothetical protein CK424_06945, partial [Legionella sp.]
MSKIDINNADELFNYIIQNTSDIIIIISADNQTIDVNKNAIKFFHQNKESIQNQTYESVCEHLKLPLKFKTFLGTEEKIKFHEYIWSNVALKTQNNEIYYIIFGKPSSEIALQHENSLLKSIIASIPGSIYWKNTKGVYLGCNDFMVRVAGFSSKNDIIGKTDSELWPNQATIFTNTDEEVINLKHPQSVEERVELPNGKTRFFTVEKTPLFDEDNNVIGILGNSLEITELKETQKELEK